MAKAAAKTSTSAKIVKSSKVDLASNTKTKVVGLLNERLADGIDLALLTKQAHWNLKGPGFIGIHLMLDGFRDDLDIHVDTVAERVAQLGGIALGTTQSTASEAERSVDAMTVDAMDMADSCAMEETPPGHRAACRQCPPPGPPRCVRPRRRCEGMLRRRPPETFACKWLVGPLAAAARRTR